MLVIWSANYSSQDLSALSNIINIRSNLDSKEYGRFTFSCGDFYLLYLPCIGFAAARIEVQALSLVVIPALAIDTVCCSMTS
jgi:hypothetical protein